MAWDGSKEGTLMVVAERTTNGIAHVIAEGSYAVELAGVGFHCQFVGGVCTIACAPSLAIHIDIWIYGVEGAAYDVHGFDVVDAHEVEAESIYMILFGPIEHRLEHELAHEGFLAGSLIAATRTV